MSLSHDKIKDLLIKAFEENNYKKFSNSESKSAIISKFDLIRNNISNYFSEKAKRNSEILKNMHNTKQEETKQNLSPVQSAANNIQNNWKNFSNFGREMK